jgi:hypothetical protein
MKKFILGGVAFAALLVGPASAADIVVRPVYRAPPPPTVSIFPFFQQQQGAPIGVAGARWGNLCWADTDSAKYAGYWRPCPRPVAARPVRVAGRAPIVAKY